MMDFLILVIFISLMVTALGIIEAVCDFLCKSQKVADFLDELEYMVFEDKYYEEDDL